MSIITPLVRSYLAVLLSALITACSGSSYAQEPRNDHAQEAHHDPYFTPTAGNVLDKLPSVILRNMIQDRDGAIWFASYAGPIRYNGENFTNFSEEVGLAKTRVFSLVETKAGDLWFGSISGGATRYDTKSFTHFTQRDGLTSTNVYCMLEDKTGNIWFGSVDRGACHYDGKSFTNFSGARSDKQPK